MGPFFLHVASVLHGLGASLGCFLVLYLAGLVLTPRRWQARPDLVDTSAFIGAAAYVLTSWYGIKAGVPLIRLEVGFLVTTLVLSAVRRRWAAAALRARLLDRATLGWLGLFAALYVLAYLFVRPPVTTEWLPIAWLGNADIFYYLNYAAYLQRLGPVSFPTIATDHFVYFQTPGAFHLLGGFSPLFGAPLGALMPAQFALVALIGLVSAWIARSVFGTSVAATATIGGAVVCAPFFRYIVGQYYLSTLFALPILLSLLVTMARQEEKGALPSARLVVSVFVHDALLFFIYPFLFFIALAFQGAVIGLRLVACLTSAPGAWGTKGWPAVRTAIAMSLAALAALSIVVCCAPGQAIWALRMVTDLSHPGVAGWPLDVISPLALLGLPVRLGSLQVVGAARPWALAGFWLSGVVALLAFVAWPIRRAVDQRIFFGLAAVGFLGYATYFAMAGPSYQQWKLASYVAMPFAFLFLAGLMAWIENGPTLNASGPVARRRYRAGIVGVVAVVLIGGNLFVHAVLDNPLTRLPGGLRNLATINKMPFRHLSVESSYHVGLLAMYYIHGKRLHVSDPTFGFSEPLAYSQVSSARPVLIVDYSCEGSGHADTVAIEGVGCVMLQPPSLALDTTYSFGRTYAFIQPRGLGVREAWGRWNARQQVELKLLADQRRARVDLDGYLNLRLRPFLRTGLRVQRLGLSWGAARHARTDLGSEEWISLPLRSGDWDGEWVSSLLLSLQLPDAVAPHSEDAGNEETRPLALAFLELSVSPVPRGRVIRPL